MQLVVRGALIGGGVGAVLGLLRGGRSKGEGIGPEVVRITKTVAEGAVAGAAVGLLAYLRPSASRAAPTT